MKRILFAFLLIPCLALANDNDAQQEQVIKDTMTRSGETIYIIDFSLNYLSNNYIMDSLWIVNNGVLSIIATTTMAGDGKIRVCNGGILNVAGKLADADVVFEPGGHLEITSGGKIDLALGKELVFPLGSTVDIQCGSIEN